MPYALFAVIMLSTLGFVGMASAQDASGAALFIQTYDHLCTGAFLNSSAISYTIAPDPLTFYAFFNPSQTDICESCAIMILDPPYELDSLRSALLERSEVFGVVKFNQIVGRSPFNVLWTINEHAQKPVGGQPACFPELDPILNNIVRNVIGSPDNDSIPTLYDHANLKDLIGVIINTHEPYRVLKYLEQNGAVMLSSGAYARMWAFVPVSLLIPLVEQHPDVEMSVMVQPSPSNNEPILDIDNATISKGGAVRYWFSVQDDDLDDRLFFTAVSSNRSIATIDASNRNVVGQPPDYRSIVRSGYMDIIPHSTGMAKVTVAVIDGASVVTGTFVVNVTDNTAPRLHVVSKMPHLVVGKENYFISAIDPDGDTLSFEIFGSAGDIESVSVSTSNNTLALTPIAQGQDDVRIMVSDGRGGYDSAEIRVCVVTSNVPPQISPMPSYIAVPVGAGTIAVPVLATDADGDIIFLFDIISYNYTVANIDYPPLEPPDFRDVVYPWPPPCESRVGGDYRKPLFITPNAVGNTTVTIRAQDPWGGKDAETFQVIVYEPTDSHYAPYWRYEIPRDLFPYSDWVP